MIFAAVCVVFAACHKVGPVDCTYKVKPLLKLTQSSTDSVVVNIIGYALLDADTTNWTVGSWDDALAGVFTNRSTGERRNYDLHSDVSPVDSLLSFRLNTTAMLLACDPEHKIYGFRDAAVAPEIPYIWISVRFSPWRKVFEYEDMKWRMIDHFWDVQEPEQPEEETGEETGETDG